MDESIDIVRAVQAGQPIDFVGDIFQLEAVQIVPAVEPRTPIVIGGRSNRAIERVGLRGDGWLGIWCSAARFAAATGMAQDIAQAQGRHVVWRHAMQMWCGLDNDKATARNHVAAAMQQFYQSEETLQLQERIAGLQAELATYEAEDYNRQIEEPTDD